MITVLMSVYNENPIYLRESIDSILNQTFRDFEFLIFDDCSNDEIKELLESYAIKDERIRLIRNETNKGLTYNLNNGVQMAKGEFICRQDSDDVSLPERLRLEYMFLKNRPDVGVVGTRFYRQFENKRKKVKTSRRLASSDYVRTCLFFGNFIMHGSVMMRKSILDRHELNYDLNFKKSQDFDLWVRVADYSKIVVLPQHLCVYRIHENQISSANNTKGEQKSFAIKVISRQIVQMFGANDEEMVKAHLNFVNCDKSMGFSKMLSYTKILLNRNKENKIFNQKLLRKLVNRYRLKFLIRRFL